MIKSLFVFSLLISSNVMAQSGPFVSGDTGGSGQGNFDSSGSVQVNPVHAVNPYGDGGSGGVGSGSSKHVKAVNPYATGGTGGSSASNVKNPYADGGSGGVGSVGSLQVKAKNPYADGGSGGVGSGGSLQVKGENPYADGGTGGVGEGEMISLAGCELVNAKQIKCADDRVFTLSTAEVNTLSRINAKEKLANKKVVKKKASISASKQ